MKIRLLMLSACMLALSACSGDAEPVAQPTVTVTAEAPEAPVDPVEPQIDRQRLGVDILKQEDPSFESVPDEDLIELFNLICNSLDGGVTFERLVTGGVESGFSARQTGRLIGAAIVSTCPEHESVLNS